MAGVSISSGCWFHHWKMEPDWTTRCGPRRRQHKGFFSSSNFISREGIEDVSQSYQTIFIFERGEKKKTVGTTKQVCRRGIRTKYGYIAQIHISMCRWVFVGATGRVRLGRVDQGGKEMELSSRLDLKTINVASLYGRTNLYQSTYLDFKYRDGKVLEH